MAFNHTNLYLNDDGSWNVGVRPTDQGSTLIDSGKASDYVGLLAQQSANKTNIQLAQMNNDFNERMWNQNNEYNTPSAQVQRLIDAGINPSSQYGSYSNVSNGQVQGTQATVQAGQYDPNAKTNRFASQIGMVQTVLQSLNQVFEQGIETQKLGIEYEDLKNRLRLGDYSIQESFARTGLTKSQTSAQEFQNSKQEQTYNNAQDLIRAQIDKALSSKEVDTQTAKQIEETTKWIPSLSSAQLSQYKAAINKTLAETNGIWSDNAVKKFQAQLAEKGIDPNADGVKQFIELLYTKPESIGKMFNTIIDGLFSSGEDIVKGSVSNPKVGAIVSSMITPLLSGLASYFTNNNSHKNP